MRVYLDYDQESIPPHPGPNWTRFVCISDTHSRVFSIPAGDVLLHAGDLSSWGHPHQLHTTLLWLKSQKHPTKIIIAGNHDLCLDPNFSGDTTLEKEEIEQLREIRTIMKSDALREADIYYLEHEPFAFVTPAGRTWKAYGSPAARKYARGAFQYSSSDEASAIYQKIPTDTEILLTHTPPYMTLDRTRREKNAGCRQLAERLATLETCRLHVFGHIHEAHGADIITEGGVERVAVNAAVAHLGSQAVLVDLRN